MVAKSDITGAVGTPAPPGAPHEVTLPGSERATPEQIAAARANEVELPPFNPGGGQQMTIAQQAIFLGKTVEEIVELRRVAGIAVTDPPDARVLATDVTSKAPDEDLTDEDLRRAGVLDASSFTVGVEGPVATTPPNPVSSPEPAAPLPAGTVLDAHGTPVTSSVRPVPPRPRRSSLRAVHKPPTVVAGESLAQQEPPQGFLEDVDTLETAPYGAQPRDSLPAPEPEPSPLPAAPPDPAKHQPAASDTDSPARGTPVPAATLAEGKRITGGFGDPAEAEYYPLDGTELRELIYALMDSIHARLQDDLRFSFAITYPRVSARVVVEIDAFAQDQTLTIEKVLVPAHEKTPLEVARRYGDQVVFCVTAERAEMTEDGQSVAPPNQTRAELQLPIPRKTAVQTPAGRMIVDVRR